MTSFLFLTWMFPWVTSWPQSYCRHGDSHELLLDLVPFFNRDAPTNFFLTSFLFLTWTFPWISSWPRSHFWHGHSHELLLDLVPIFGMDIPMNYFLTLFLFLTWMFPWIIFASWFFFIDILGYSGISLEDVYGVFDILYLF